MTAQPDQRPLVGVGAFLFRPDGTFLMLRRRGYLGAGCWGLIGGHLEFGESPEDTASREVFEEVGLILAAQSFFLLGLTNDVMKAEGKHYLSLYMGAEMPDDQIPVNKEPQKAEKLGWYDVETAPKPYFAPLKLFFRHHPDPYALFKASQKGQRSAAFRT